MDITRRRLLAALAGAVVAGPTLIDASAAAASGVLPRTQPWRPRAGEVQPSVKAQATRLIEAAAAWPTGRGGAAAARTRADAAGFDARVVGSLGPLLGPATSAVVQVRDAQYGGLLTSSASVLVVLDQWTLQADGSVRSGGTTVDVRLVRASPRWRVVDAFPADPGRAAAGISQAAERVLADPRIHLPYAAGADVRADRIHDSVLQWLSQLSARHVVDVSVLRSGHPLHVFGTSRMSDHPRGRAVDVWALDGRPLVVPSNHALAASAMRFAVAHGAYNVGGPVQLQGRQYFSDLTHQDHIHLGFAR